MKVIFSPLILALFLLAISQTVFAESPPLPSSSDSTCTGLFPLIQNTQGTVISSSEALGEKIAGLESDINSVKGVVDKISIQNEKNTAGIDSKASTADVMLAVIAANITTLSLIFYLKKQRKW